MNNPVSENEELERRVITPEDLRHVDSRTLGLELLRRRSPDATAKQRKYSLCKFCNCQFYARQLKEHRPICRYNPRNKNREGKAAQ